MTDINGDGLPDVLKNFLSRSGPNRLVYLNTGKGWLYHEKYTNTMPDTYITGQYYHLRIDMGTRIADIDGDGLKDLIQLYYKPPGHSNPRGFRLTAILTRKKCF